MSEPKGNKAKFDCERVDEAPLHIDMQPEFEPWSLPAETDLDKVRMGGLNFDDDLPGFAVFMPSQSKYEH
ncbi:MAG TPA: hypothetical protein VNT79_18475 [Phycisphaerae bacterium]|nr:hypothetical protein [Phycisphaerae bacterium]